MNWSRCSSCDAALTDVYRLRDHSFCWSCRQDEDSSDSDDGRKLKSRDTSTSSSWRAAAGMLGGLQSWTRALLAIFSEPEASGPSVDRPAPIEGGRSTDLSLYIALNQAAPC